ncbi:hypothetical protein Tco_0688229 [Tanacetum coccineum]
MNRKWWFKRDALLRHQPPYRTPSRSVGQSWKRRKLHGDDPTGHQSGELENGSGNGTWAHLSRIKNPCLIVLELDDDTLQIPSVSCSIWQYNQASIGGGDWRARPIFHPFVMGVPGVASLGFRGGQCDVKTSCGRNEDLKYRDHTMVSNEIKESMISTWLIRSYKKKFEEYMEIKKQKEEYRLDAEWVIDLLEKRRMKRIKTDIFQFKTPLCEAFKEFNYLLKIDVDIIDPRWNLVMILNMFASRFASRMDMLGGPLAIGKWKNIAMMAILEESMNMQEESSDNVRTHYSPSDKWEDFEHAKPTWSRCFSLTIPSILDVSRIFNDHGGINNDYET